MASPPRLFTEKLDTFVHVLAKAIVKGIEEESLHIRNVGFPDIYKPHVPGLWRIDLEFLTSDPETSKIIINFIESLRKEI